ncbi:MAG: DNA alkylation repair protein [Acidobacteria bacterium]|nr:DNA alkylation repair protein [Acidobacteriota bacterium]
MHNVIRAVLIAQSEPWKLPVMQRFFKDPIDAYCTYMVHVRNLAKEHWREFASWSHKERLALTRALWESGKFEEGAVAIQLYARMWRRCEHREWKLFVKWLEKYVRNWAHCDALCGDVMALMLITHPEWIEELPAWSKAKQIYKRRAALVAPLKGLRTGMFRNDAEALLEMLEHDRTDIIGKARVWMRKELAR